MSAPLTLLVCGGLLVACGGGTPAPRGHRGERPAAAPGQALRSDTPPDLLGPDGRPPAAEEPWEWAPPDLSGRDPFEPVARPVVDPPPVDPAEEADDLGDLVISGTPLPKVMLTDGRGRGHVVRVGARLGRQGCRVERIGPGGLVLRCVKAGTGEVRRRILPLRKGR